MRFPYRATALAFALPLFAAGIAAVFAASSGPNPGQSVFPFDPVHVTGADKGTKTCPVCKYGATPAVQVWVNEDNMDNVGKIAESLESAITKAGGPAKLKAFVVFIKPEGASNDDMAGKLNAMAESHKLKNVALVYVDGPTDGAVKTYKINTDPSVKNTAIVYSKRKVVANYVNLQGDAEGLKAFAQSVAGISQPATAGY